ncbi:MAG: hypothetical protein WDW36_002207 [Sanguina aurantia]
MPEDMRQHQQQADYPHHESFEQSAGNGGVHRQHAGLPHQRPKQLAFSNARGVRHSHQRRSDQELSGFLQDLPSQASDLEQRAERAIQHLQLQLKAASHSAIQNSDRGKQLRQAY